MAIWATLLLGTRTLCNVQETAKFSPWNGVGLTCHWEKKYWRWEWYKGVFFTEGASIRGQLQDILGQHIRPLDERATRCVVPYGELFNYVVWIVLKAAKDDVIDETQKGVILPLKAIAAEVIWVMDKFPYKGTA